MKFFNARGAVSIWVLLAGVLVAAAIIGVHLVATNALHTARFANAQSTATTTLTVLDVPPNWTVNPQTTPASNTSTPTNVGNTVTWIGTATSPNANNYYLLICMTSSTPTAGVSGGPPTCGGGAGNQWAVSTSTVSGVQASSTYVASSTTPQIDAWFAWVCDNNFGGAKCNSTFEQGSGLSGSPFAVDHSPNFTSLTNNSPTAPGGVVVWSTTASSTDNFTGSTSTIQLFVCKSNDFTGSACGAAGTYCTSATTTLNPTCSSTLPIPDQDRPYNSYGYILNPYSLIATGPGEATNSIYTVSNVAPFVSSSSISILNTTGSSTPLTLTQPSGQTNGFLVKFTASDNNSCLASGGGQEVASALLNVYRSGIGQSSCQTSGNYSPDNCYPAAVGTSTWNYGCSQDAGSCSGSSSITATWTCTFPLWYVSDPTDASSAFSGQSWNTSVQLTNDIGATSSLTQGSTGATLASFLAAQLNTNSINFGSLNPGSTTVTLSTSTVFLATGNVGLNQTLYGVSMCPNYPTCPVSTTSTIPVGQIQYATSSVAYGSGTGLLVSPGALFPIQIRKSTATSTNASGSTFWGISVPSSIDLSGAYTGQNTFVAVESPSSAW